MYLTLVIQTLKINWARTGIRHQYHMEITINKGEKQRLDYHSLDSSRIGTCSLKQESLALKDAQAVKHTQVQQNWANHVI